MSTLLIDEVRQNAADLRDRAFRKGLRATQLWACGPDGEMWMTIFTVQGHPDMQSQVKADTWNEMYVKAVQFIQTFGGSTGVQNSDTSSQEGQDENTERKG